MAALVIGNVYTFNTLSPSILGVSFINVKLIGIMDYTSALQIENVNVKYRAIYPTLPSGTINDPSVNLYYHFQTQSGEKILLAEQWVDLPTVVLITTVDFKITLTTATVQDMNTIRDVLNGMGYSNFVIEQI